VSHVRKAAFDRRADSTAPLDVLHDMNRQIVHFRANAIGGISGDHNDRRAARLVRSFRDATEERFAFELEKLFRLAKTRRGARGENQRAGIASSAELFAWIGALQSRRWLPVPPANTA